MPKKLIIVIIIIVLVLLGVNFYNNMAKINKLEKRIEELNNQIEATRHKNDELKTQLENVNDIEYIEKMAREKLGLVKPGEILLIPVEEDKKDQ